MPLRLLDSHPASKIPSYINFNGVVMCFLSSSARLANLTIPSSYEPPDYITLFLSLSHTPDASFTSTGITYILPVLVHTM